MAPKKTAPKKAAKGKIPSAGAPAGGGAAPSAGARRQRQWREREKEKACKAVVADAVPSFEDKWEAATQLYRTMTRPSYSSTLLGAGLTKGAKNIYKLKLLLGHAIGTPSPPRQSGLEAAAAGTVSASTTGASAATRKKPAKAPGPKKPSGPIRKAPKKAAATKVPVMKPLGAVSYTEEGMAEGMRGGQRPMGARCR